MPATANTALPPPPAPSQYALCKEDQEDLRAINASVDRMRKLTAPAPYFLTIPQEVEPRYHHLPHPQWRDQWRDKLPFDRNEHESLQYQTFIYHEHGKDMYELHSTQHEDHSATNGNARPRPDTPNQGPKKKISFDTYKRKQNGNPTTPDRGVVKVNDAPAKQGALKGPVERLKAETNEMLAAVEESEEEILPVKQDYRTKPKDLKRKREEGPKQKQKVPEKATVSDNIAEKQSSTPATKKTRVSDGNSSKIKDETSSFPQKPESHLNLKTFGQESEDTGMPPRLSPPRFSPGLPEKLSPLHNAPGSKSPKHAKTEDPPESLPRRLSSTIPENILKTLEARTQFRSTPRSSNPSAPNSATKDRDGKLTPLPKTDGVTKRKSPIPRNGFRASSSSPAVRSDVEDKDRSLTSAPRAKSPDVSQLDEDPAARAPKTKKTEKPEAPSDKGEEPDKPGRPSLLVRIKYKKSLRESIQRILRMRSTPKPAPPPPKQATEETKSGEKAKEKRNGEKKDNQPQKGVAQKIQPIKKDKKAQPKQEEKLPTAEKRPPPENDNTDIPAKRRKVEESRKAPSTPAPNEVDSPLTQKPGPTLTPGARKEFLPPAMQRQQSQDSITAYNTPAGQSSTPGVNGQPSGLTRPTSSQHNTKTSKQQAWETEQNRLQALGRELKYEATSCLGNGHPPPSQRKLAAAKAFESFLCYLCAFTCMDEAASAAEPKQTPPFKTWLSLQGFFGFVKRTTEAYPQLCSIACSLGMVFTTRTLEIATRYTSSSSSSSSERPHYNALIETQSLLHKTAFEAEKHLDPETLADVFPRTWAGRQVKPSLSNEHLEPNRLSGPYKFPVRMTTTPLQGARAGLAVLEEWLEKEKVKDYTLKLKLKL